MNRLFEFLVGVLLGAFTGFLLFEGLFGEDTVQRESAKRSQKAYCETYKEELMVSQSPEDKMHQVKLYSRFCSEAE
ncbi:hypothetical protein [Thermocrinis sp.]|jgi:hypothetical protein|uniref:hypothetical protein n=1 Tax=Thermocrinis sp. TaxID=2024383 RepID=UPI003C0D38FD